MNGAVQGVSFGVRSGVRMRMLELVACRQQSLDILGAMIGMHSVQCGSCTNLPPVVQAIRPTSCILYSQAVRVPPVFNFLGGQ